MKSKRIDITKVQKKSGTAYEFSDKKIPASYLQKILEAGRWAPSALNSQPWKFLLVEDPEKIDKLMDLCAYGHFHNPPKTIIVISLDSTKISKKHRGVFYNEIGEIDAYVSLGAPMALMDIQAKLIGISSAILTPDLKKAQKIVNLQKKYLPLVMLGLGLPANTKSRSIPRTRNQLEEIMQGEKT